MRSADFRQEIKRLQRVFRKDLNGFRDGKMNELETINIPEPPASLLDINEGLNRFLPAEEFNLFLEQTILDENHFLFNDEHLHLSKATIGFLWTSAPNARQMKRIVGTAEMPLFRGNRWQKARQEQQIEEWFGCQPDFLITFDASFWAESSAAERLAVFEHELYHCAQAVDAFGMPRFSRMTGKPIFSMRAHDVEEFTGVVRRYGIGATGQDRVDFAAAAAEKPLIAEAQIKAMCGTCAG